MDGVETWQVYGFGGELIAEYAANAAAASPQKEYGYRNGQLLITAEAQGGGGGGSAQNVAWTNAVGVSVSGNNLTRTAAGDGWNAGARSSQSIASGDGYAEFTASETNKRRTMGLTLNTTVSGYQYINFGIYLGDEGQITIHEGVTVYGVFGTYTSGDKLRVAVEGGVVKYRKNGTLLRTSTLAPSYPLYAGGALYTNGSTVTNAVINSGGDSSAVQFNWLVTDHLGTPRMIFEQTGILANVKRHDYLPFGEELFAPTGGRSAPQGYAGGDGVRQQFTLKERDVETGLDYFGARYYASMQGRFTGVDPYDINFERQETDDREEAEALFRDYLFQPQHWNRYVYALNNPLRYVDPDGLMSYEAELLGKKIKIHIDDSILKKDPGALKRIQDNLQKAFDKINAGADKLTKEQKESIGSMKGISVSRSGAIGMSGGTFQITQRMAENPNVDKLSADIIHDSRHAEQAKRGLSYNEKTAIPMEMEASQFTVGVINNIGGWDAKVVKGYERDAATGHLPNRKWKDKSTPKSRTRVFEKMKGPRN